MTDNTAVLLYKIIKDSDNTSAYVAYFVMSGSIVFLVDRYLAGDCKVTVRFDKTPAEILDATILSYNKGVILLDDSAVFFLNKVKESSKVIIKVESTYAEPSTFTLPLDKCLVALQEAVRIAEPYMKK